MNFVHSSSVRTGRRSKMHQINYTIRQIVEGDLPMVRDSDTDEDRPATDQELLNFGMQHLHDDIYSCVEQYRRDENTLEWNAHGVAPVGAVVVHGPDRYSLLPTGVRGKVMLARVVRSSVDGETPLAIAQANLAEQSNALAENVGPVDGAPLVDLLSDDAAIEEASRLARIRDTGLELAMVPMVVVDPSAHVVEADGIEPHRWAGERLPRPST